MLIIQNLIQVFCESKIVSEARYIPTIGKEIHNISLLLDNTVVHCKLIDIPSVSSIPKVKIWIQAPFHRKDNFIRSSEERRFKDFIYFFADTYGRMGRLQTLEIT